MAQLGQEHSVPEALLQLHWGRQLLLQAGLHPAESMRAACDPLGQATALHPIPGPSSLPLSL